MNQPPFNPLQELANDTSGLTHRANKRLREWMEYHNEAYERENCPVGGCDPTLDSAYKGENPVKPSSNEIKCWGESIMCCPSDEWMAEIKIDWNSVRERMNDWVKKTQNPECHKVFFRYNNEICEELERQDFPPKVDERLVKYHNLGEGWHGFSYPKDKCDHVGEINVMLLDKAWDFIMGQQSVDGHFDTRLHSMVFGREENYERGVSEPVLGDVYVKFKISHS